jgi:hypothetical protein
MGAIDPSTSVTLLNEDTIFGRLQTEECPQEKVLSNGLINGGSRGTRIGAAYSFRVVGLVSDRLVKCILEQQLQFDSLY